MDESMRKVRRFVDGNINYNYRRNFVIILVVFGLIWLVGIRLFRYEDASVKEPIDCLSRKLQKLQTEVLEMDTNIIHIPLWPEESETAFKPYIGNGYLGSAIYEEAKIHIKPKYGRTLSVPLPFHPIVRVALTDEDSRNEALVSQYAHGMVQRIACIERDHDSPLEVVTKYYTHRTFPSIFEQHISVRNPSKSDTIVEFDQLGWSGEPPFKSQAKRIQQGDVELNYVLGSGMIEVDKANIAVAIAYRKVPSAIEVKAKSTLSIRFVTAVNYQHLDTQSDFETVQKRLLTLSEKDLKKALGQNVHNFQSLHEKAWSELWSTGFYISTSLAKGALNGNKINATMYYVLSQVKDLIHETNIPASQIAEASAVLSYAEGCYGGHHTLQAPSLWSNLYTESDILAVSNLWLLTLEKMGCHNLLKAGAYGVMQGMILSFGALKFRNQHLEFNTEPKDLHRDYIFRRIWYGNATHVNISVTVGHDNKATIFAALDRSDKDYYACDAGCLDPPIQLGPVRKKFPVKVTEPITSVLYITSDKQHVEDLRLSIHVKEVFEAPAHENHVISMHKHGSGYGTMSTMFWISISTLIILFHIFLFHLVYTEYFGTNQDKFRQRLDSLDQA